MMWWALAALVALLYLIDERVKFIVKHATFIAFIMLASMLMCVLALLKIIPKSDVDNFDIAKVLVINLMKIFCLKINVQKADNLQMDAPCIVVANHQSSLDLIGMMHVWPQRCVPMAKRELKWAGPFGFAATICGTIFIDRLNHHSAMNTMKRVAETVTSQNIKVWIFPEGTRFHGKGMLPFKKGAFYLAVQAQIPIVPVVFSSYHEFYDKKKLFFRSPGEFTIEVLPAVDTKGFTSDDVPRLIESVRDQMLQTYLRISDFSEADLDPPLRPKKEASDAVPAAPKASSTAEAATVTRDSASALPEESCTTPTASQSPSTKTFEDTSAEDSSKFESNALRSMTIIET